MAPRKTGSYVSETERVVGHFGRTNSFSREDKSIHLSGHSVSRGVSHDYASPEARSSPAEMKVMIRCSYGGKIIPRPRDGKLSYVGGRTRNICVRKDVSWQELTQETFAWMYDNETHVIKYLLPKEDLDALVAVSSDEDVLNMMDKWGEIENRLGKLRMFLISTSDLDHDDARFGSVDSYSERFGRGYPTLSSEAHPIGSGKFSNSSFAGVDNVDWVRIRPASEHPQSCSMNMGIYELDSSDNAGRSSYADVFFWLPLIRLALRGLLLCFLATLLYFLATAFFLR